MNPTLYRIGQFSQFTKVTVKALRFYEAEGLLSPTHIDPHNGYRFYSSSQLPTVYTIVALKQSGFSLPDIRQVLELQRQGKSCAALFAKRQRQIEAQIVQNQAQLARIAHSLEQMRNPASSPYQIVLKDLPGCLVFSCRTIVADYDAYFQLMPALGQEALAANPGLQCVSDPPYCFVEYHDGEYRDKNIDIEFCEAVYQMGKDTDRIHFKRIPAIPQAACVLHKGPYTSLAQAYAALFAWIDQNRFEATGNPRESYIDGIWNHSDAQQWLTEIQVPIKAR